MSAKREHHRKMNELLRRVKKDLHDMIDDAWASGGMSEAQKQGNFLLPKAVITIYGRREVWGPVGGSSEEDMENLSHFI